MASFNRVILCGNITRDIQLEYMPSGSAVADFGLAMNRKWKPEGGGEMREEVCFVDCKVFGKQAETLNQYSGKGKPLLVEGRLKLDTWEAKDGGGKRSKLYVIVEGFQFMDAPKGQSGSQGDSGGDRADRAVKASSRPQIASNDADDNPAF
jgi:single-strand DNA-binding protein